MSYSITVESIGGTHSVAVSGEVPEGKHVISGHEDASNATLSVSRARHDGVYVASASSSHVKEN